MRGKAGLWELGVGPPLRSRDVALPGPSRFEFSVIDNFKVICSEDCLKGKQAHRTLLLRISFSSLLQWQAADLILWRTLQLNARKHPQVLTWILERIHTSRTCTRKLPLRMATATAMAEEEIEQPVCHRV